MTTFGKLKLLAMKKLTLPRVALGGRRDELDCKNSKPSGKEDDEPRVLTFLTGMGTMKITERNRVARYLPSAVERRSSQ